MLPLQIFEAGVKELLAFLESAENQEELNARLLNTGNLQGSESELLHKVTSASTNNRRYIYILTIISLYGLLERLVDSLVERYVILLSSIVGVYEQMPSAIKDNHIRVSLDLAKAVTEEKHRTSIKPEEVIANLHSCLAGLSNFRVNAAAFVLHRGNINLTRIGEFLSGVGITTHLRRVTRTSHLIAHFKERDPERDIIRTPDQELHTLLNGIDDLVERRNEIAHGVINVDQIESIDFLKERCHLLLAYGQALNNILVQELLSYKVHQSDVLCLGNPIEVHYKSIACFEAGNCKILPGDLMAASTGILMEPFRYSPIISLEKDGVSQDAIDTVTPVQFGAKVLFHAATGYTYYVISPDAFN